MPYSVGVGEDSTLRFSTGELTGAVGDSVTVLPIVVAVAALSERSLAVMLVGFGVFQVVWGLRYGLPVSVEPMKALAALVVAGALTSAELTAAGLLAGGVLLVAGRTRTLEHIERVVGEPVVRGVQLAVALVLLETGVRLGIAGLTLALAAAAVVLLATLIGHRRASALAVLAAGAAVAGWTAGFPGPAVPRVALAWPSPSALRPGAVLGGAAGQLAMTVGNAAVATSLLLGDLYDADVSADQLATSMGAMNLLAVPLGAMPMCHGSGGVAGKHAFGARTAAANLVLGAVYAVAALVGVGLVAAFPMPMLGVVLAVVGLQLARASLDTARPGLTVGVGLIGVLANVGVAFVVGVAVAAVLRQRDG